MTRRVEIEDFARIKYVSDPQISPDDSRVAYVVTDVLLDEKRYRSRIWLADVETGETRQLTRGDGKDTSPRWSLDGSQLAFLTDRWDAKNQIARLSLSGGEAEQVSDLHDGVLEFEWTSSGRGFLFLAKADHDHVLKHKGNVEEPEDRSNEPLVITRLSHKLDGSGFKDGRRSQVGIALHSARIVQLTSGDYDHAQPVLSPCRRYLAFVSNRSDNRDNERVSDIWILDLDNDSMRQVTGGDGNYGLPAFSPDSKHLAIVGHRVEEPYGPTSLDRLWVADLDNGGVRCLSQDIDREMSNTCIGDSTYLTPAQRPVWTPDGTALLSLVSDRGAVHVTRVALDGTTSPVTEGNQEVMNVSVSSSGGLAFTVSAPSHPAEVFVGNLDNPGDRRRLTSHNRDYLCSVRLSSPNHVPCQSSDGTALDAWLLEPVDRAPGAKYPLVVEIHGGPHAMYGHTYFHEFQMLAARGYGVLYTNPRGSTGYGQKFVSAAMGDWGGVDYQDVMDCLDQTVREFDWIDTNRLGVTGGSYGGYLVNWIVTQSDRFRAAITQRSTCNRYNLFGTSDMVWSYSAWEFRGMPWENSGHYLDRSPIMHVESITTPVLIMHSERDLRCPVEQGEQFFAALKRLDKTTEFVRFPEESHNLSRSGRPDRRRERLRWMLSWFDRYL